MHTVEIVLALVVLATLVAAFARRLRVPPPSLLVLVGLGVAALPGAPAIRATPDLVSLVVLPPLLYAAGEQLSIGQLRAVWRPVSVLAVGLVVASAVAVAAITVAVTGIPPATAFVLGAVLASTDPVAVTALGRRLGLPSRLQTLVVAESLFNDATSLVLFKVALAVVVAGGSVAWGHAAAQFVQLGGGGALIGSAVAGAVIVVRRRISDPVLETVSVLVTPYLSYVIAEAAHTSGVTAVVLTSLIVGHRMRRHTAARVRLQVDAVYDTVIFLLESVVFALIGLQLPLLIRALPTAEEGWPWQSVVLALTVVVVRAVWVFPMAALTARRAGTRRPSSWQAPAVVSWAGARGVVPLAAALSIPLSVSGGAPLDHRSLVVLLATAVIAFTLVVQGLSLGPLVKRAGLQTDDDHRSTSEVQARSRLGMRARAHLDDLGRLDAAPDHILDRLRDNLDRRSDGPVDPGAEASYRSVRRQLISVELEELERLRGAGAIDAATYQRLQRALDLEDAALDEEP